MNKQLSRDENKKCCSSAHKAKNILISKFIKTGVNYKPLIVIFTFCLILAFLHAYGALPSQNPLMNGFMGYFFIFFSMLKFFDLKGFVKGFETYDIIARKWRSYGFLYPFIELFLGIAYLSNLYSALTNMITLLVMIISGIGVAKSLFSGQKLKCACLGTALNVPLSRVSIIENFGMGAMAAYMLLAYFIP